MLDNIALNLCPVALIVEGFHIHRYCMTLERQTHTHTHNAFKANLHMVTVSIATPHHHALSSLGAACPAAQTHTDYTANVAR